MPKHLENFGLSSARKEMGFTQTKLAQVLNVNPTTVVRWDKRTPPVHVQLMMGRLQELFETDKVLSQRPAEEIRKRLFEIPKVSRPPGRPPNPLRQSDSAAREKEETQPEIPKTSGGIKGPALWRAGRWVSVAEAHEIDREIKKGAHETDEEINKDLPYFLQKGLFPRNWP